MNDYTLRYENYDSEREQEIVFQASDDDQARAMKARFVEDGLTVWAELSDPNGCLIEE